MQLNLAEEQGFADPAVKEENFAAAAERLAPQTELVTLRRTGQRPISFRGAVVAHGMSFRVGTPLWYEVNIFSVASGGYVGNVRMFTKAEGEQDKFAVHVAGSIEEVVDFLEGYNPAEDIAVDINLDDRKASLADLTFAALALRARKEGAVGQYESLVSEIFTQLEAAQAAGEA